MDSYVMRFSVRGPVRYLSHLELMKIFRQALRRASFPTAYSEGFNPHMKLSFAIAKGVGLESQGELLEVEAREPVNPEIARQKINEALPGGIEVLEILLKEGNKALSALVEKARYLIRGDEALLARAMMQLEREELLWEVRSKRGVAQRNLKEHIGEISRTSEGILLFLDTGSKRNLRVDYLLDCLGGGLSAIRLELWGEHRPLLDMMRNNNGNNDEAEVLK